VKKKQIIFLGTAAALQLPSFHCNCDICNNARKGEIPRKTRAALAIKGNQIILIDCGPDIAYQLERENINKIDAIFITHWHYDHIGGLSEFGEPASVARWPPIKLFIPKEDMEHFKNELSYLKKVFDITPIFPGFNIKIDDVYFKAVKTTHSSDSLGYIIEHNKKCAYLADGIRPPDETIRMLEGIDCLILEATMDELDEKWMNFDIKGAIDFWKETGIKECILTHMSFHSWKNGMLTQGYGDSKLRHIEKENKGLIIAYDGMRIDF